MYDQPSLYQNTQTLSTTLIYGKKQNMLQKNLYIKMHGLERCPCNQIYQNIQ